MTIDILKDGIGAILVWLVLIAMLLLWPLAEFARGMASNPGSVPMCRKCAIISVAAAICILSLFWS